MKRQAAEKATAGAEYAKIVGEDLKQKYDENLPGLKRTISEKYKNVKQNLSEVNTANYTNNLMNM